MLRLSPGTLLVAALGWPGFAVGQNALPVPLPAAAVPPAPPPALPPSPVAPPPLGAVEMPPSDPLLALAGESAPLPGQQHRVAVNLSVFQPFTARLGVKAWSRPNDSLWVEVYAGSVLFDAVFGVGARVQHTARVYANGDVLMVAPGLGVHAVTGGFTDVDGDAHRYFLAGDVDVSWLHEFGPRCGYELGLKLGLAGLVSGPPIRDGFSRNVMFGGSAYPILAFYSGFRF